MTCPNLLQHTAVTRFINSTGWQIGGEILTQGLTEEITNNLGPFVVHAATLP
jgi:hypothetical protein